MTTSGKRLNWKVTPHVHQVSGTLDILPTPQSFDGSLNNTAIKFNNGLTLLTKATAGAYTLKAPGLDMNNLRMEIVSTTAAAHTITTSAGGFNGANSVATFGAAIGNGLTLIAYNGSWYARGQVGITFSG